MTTRSNPSATTTTTVRHSGRAHIRGKIRRIWRARYLELLDSGFVRYYEIMQEDHHGGGGLLSHPQVSFQKQEEEDDWNHVGMIPKCTLTIHHARIIDVTTLRDLHVGLPMGAFGFLFHGQRHFVFSETACHPPDPVAPRDFLCAVSTLEQAQSWVVALQWAAQRTAVHQTLPVLGSAIVGSSWQQVDLYQEEFDEDDFRFDPPRQERQRRRPTDIQSPKDAFQVVRSSTPPPSSSRKKKSSVVPTNTKKPGKIVVTKVVPTVRLVRVKEGFDWAYHVHVLLIQSTVAEERSVWRTRGDLLDLLEKLQTELADQRTAQATLSAVQETLRPHIATTHQPPPLFSNSLSHMKTSVPHVNAALRSLAMNAAICNSQSLRHFWTLSSSENDSHHTPSQSPWGLLIPTNQGLYSQRFLDMPATEQDTEEFVKGWLQLPQDEPKEEPYFLVKEWAWSVCLWLLQRPPSVLLGVVAVGLVGLPRLGSWYKHGGAVVSFQMRIDVLLLSWTVMAYAGRWWERQQGLSSSSSSATNLDATVPPSRLAPTNSAIAAAPKEEVVSDASLVDIMSSDDEEEDAIQDEDLRQEAATEKVEKEVSTSKLSSPLPEHPDNGGASCWSKPPDNIFRVRGGNYLVDRVKIPSGASPFVCRGVDVWLTDNPERHIARHPSVLGGKLGEQDTFLVNFLLPFGNFVAYFGIPPMDQFPPRLANVWTKFLNGDQEYRDARLKLLPVVVDGPWIVKTAVGPGTSPALLGKVIPLQYFFRAPTPEQKGVYEVDVIITASRIAKGILSVVKGHTKMLTIAFALIIEAAEEADLPETALSTFQMHSIHLEDCPQLPECNLDDIA